MTLCINISILLKKSGGHLPRVELEEMGPSFDFEMRRSQLASAGDFKKACRQPKANKVLIIKHDSCQNQKGCMLFPTAKPIYSYLKATVIHY